MKQVKILGLLVLCAVLIGSVQATPVVRNAGFEDADGYTAGYTDTITPWETVTGFWRIYDTTDGGLDYAYPDLDPNPWSGLAITNAAADGKWGELKQKAYEADGVTPSVITENMSLTFNLDVSSQAGSFQADWFQVLLRLDIDGTIVGASDQVTVPLYGTWENKTVTVSIPDTTYLVGQEYSFSFWNNNGNPYYDNVTIVPEPATMLLLGLGGLVIRRKR